MVAWERAEQSREQLVLFATRLDEVVGSAHPVRLLDEILGRVDWTSWESQYHGGRGRPPIHPRVLAGAWLYGLLKRIRSSRALEESLVVRLDFRWLVEGRTIDHTTLSEFRRRHPEALRDLFVQVGLVARELGFLPLEQLAYDGTQVRSNSRRGGTRSPAELRELREKLAARFTELEQRVAERDREDAAAPPLPANWSGELADTRQRLRQIEAALGELARVEAAGETVPGRVPLTDPESRVPPNKDGGFAPNYTPLATVDADSGLIAACDVLALTNEEHALLPQLAQVQRDYGLNAPPQVVLADGKMVTGANLQALSERGITLYAPAPSRDPAANPALRADLAQPVPREQWDRLPQQATQTGAGLRRQLRKEAFVYDSGRDVYWCPQGRTLRPEQRTSEASATGRQSRMRYKAAASDCAGCPLRDRCLQGQATRREISRYDHEPLVEQLSERMATPEAQARYARRREVAERPFAVIKQQLGVRQFLLRGLAQVRMEWCWLATAFNLGRLLALCRAGPAAVTPSLSHAPG